MLARRLLMLAAVLMLLTALAAGLAPREDPEPARQAAPTLPAGETVVETIRADPGATRRVPVRRGDRLELQVAGDLLDSVLIERLDRMDAIAPSTPARFDLVIEAPAGSYPIRLVEADRRIGSLVIRD